MALYLHENMAEKANNMFLLFKSISIAEALGLAKKVTFRYNRTRAGISIAAVDYFAQVVACFLNLFRLPAQFTC